MTKYFYERLVTHSKEFIPDDYIESFDDLPLKYKKVIRASVSDLLSEVL